MSGIDTLHGFFRLRQDTYIHEEEVAMFSTCHRTRPARNVFLLRLPFELRSSNMGVSENRGP